MSGLEPGPESGLAGDSSPSHPSMRALVDSSVSSYLSPRPLYSTPSVQSSDSVHTSDSTPAVPPEPLFRTTPMTPNEAQMLEDHAQWIDESNRVLRVLAHAHEGRIKELENTVKHLQEVVAMLTETVDKMAALERRKAE